MTLDEIVYHRRVRVLDRAGQTSITEVSDLRNQPHDLLPLGGPGRALRRRRTDAQGSAIPGHAQRPSSRDGGGGAGRVGGPTTLGARRLLEHLADRDVVLSASGVQKVLVRNHLGRRAQRVAALAQITAAGSGLLTEAAKEGPFGFCHFAARPGDLVALDTFYVGKLKGVGTVWQLTAVDTATRWAICRLFVGDKSAQGAADFVYHIVKRLAEIGVELTRVLTGIHTELNGPEFTGRAFTGHPAELDVVHHRIRPRSPNHNAVCECFQGTAYRSSTGLPSTASASTASSSWTASSRAGSAATTPTT